jgi:hypothetical protein
MPAMRSTKQRLCVRILKSTHSTWARGEVAIASFALPQYKTRAPNKTTSPFCNVERILPCRKYLGLSIVTSPIHRRLPVTSQDSHLSNTASIRTKQLLQEIDQDTRIGIRNHLSVIGIAYPPRIRLNCKSHRLLRPSSTP